LTDVVLYSQVAPLHVALYEGQVTGLLGPNGAGKSTTIAMLTGLTPPSGGDAIVAGHSLLGSLAECRRCLGVCPQQNVLFPSLTCAEHLRIFAVLKGVPSRDVNREISKKLREVGLEQKGEARASTLSGGMKRRLQMAMALIGPSKVVLLDEPTSGLDPRSRRDAWKLIRAAAKGRCVVLTTHFLEEADLLCDRVCVISDGKLRCAGSPPFLKNTLGGKYALTLTFDDDRESTNRVSTADHAERGVAFGSEVRRGCRFEPREGGRGDG
jgi:ABC-type multidrug transport system ATPase subunit